MCAQFILNYQLDINGWANLNFFIVHLVIKRIQSFRRKANQKLSIIPDSDNKSYDFLSRTIDVPWANPFGDLRAPSAKIICVQTRQCHSGASNLIAPPEVIK